MAFTTLPGTGAAATTLVGTTGIDTVSIAGDLTSNFFVGAQPSADVINLTGAVERSNVTIKGGQGADSISFGSGSLANSFLNGNSDADTFGSDADRAQLSNSTLQGGQGTDSIFLSSVTGDAAGSAIINGNKQADSLNLSGVATNAQILGGADNDTITLGNLSRLTNSLVKGDKGNDTITISIQDGDGGNSTNSTIQGADGLDTLNASTATAALLMAGGGGADSITGGGNTDTLNGGAGGDSIQGNVGADQLSGGAGNDQFIYVTEANLFTAGNAIVDVINGNAGTDSVEINNGAVAFTIAAADTFGQSTNIQQINAFAAASAAISVTLDDEGVAAGLNTIDLSGDTDATANNVLSVGAVTAQGFTLTGSAGSDNAAGGGGADVISGGAGADSVVGGAAADTITGGAGADTYNGNAGADRLTFETTQALNGTDVFTGFTVGAGGDFINFNFGQGNNLANNAALRGAGTGFARLGAGAALGANVGFVAGGIDIADAAAADTYAEGLAGEGAGDIIYLLASTDVNAATGDLTLYEVNYTGVGASTLTSLGSALNQTLDNLTAAANLVNFA